MGRARSARQPPLRRPMVRRRANRGATCALNRRPPRAQYRHQSGTSRFPANSCHRTKAGHLGRTIVRLAPCRQATMNQEIPLPETALPLQTPPQDVQRRLAAGEKFLLVDVREPAEFQVARIPGAELIPMRTVPAQLQRLEAASDEDTLIV